METPPRPSLSIPPEMEERARQLARRLWGWQTKVSRSGLIKQIVADWISRVQMDDLDARIRKLESKVPELQGDEEGWLLNPEMRRLLKLPSIPPPKPLDAPRSSLKANDLQAECERLQKKYEKRIMTGHLDPCLFHGFRDGMGYDLGSLAEVGIPLMRSPSLYLPSCKTWHRLYARTVMLGRPEAVWVALLDGRIVVVDGIATLHAVAIHRASKPESFPAIPYYICTNQFEDACRWRLIRNLDAGSRSLTRYEIETALKDIS